MNTKTLALALILLGAMLTHALPQTPQWVEVAPPGGRFSVMMPEKPVEQTQTDDRSRRPYTGHMLGVQGREVSFIVSWVDYKSGVVVDAQHEFTASRDEFLKPLKARLTSEKKINLDGNPGIEFLAENEQHIIKSRLYVVGRRPYLLSTVWFKNKPEPATVATFFESFKLLPSVARD